MKGKAIPPTLGLLVLILGSMMLGIYAWGNGSSKSEKYPYYGVHDAVAEYAYLKLKEYNETIARWITDFYLSPYGSKWGDWGYSYGQGSDNWLGYTDDPDSYYMDWDNHFYYVHGEARGAPRRIAQLYEWVVANLTSWIKAGMPYRSEDEHKAAYAAGLLTHYLVDMSQFGHTDYTKMDHSHPSYDPKHRTYHGYYESASIGDEFLDKLTADLEAYNIQAISKVENVSQIAVELAEWTNLGPNGITIEFEDIDGSIRLVGSNYARMLKIFVTNYDSRVYYLGARGYNSTIYELTLRCLERAMEYLINILYSAFKDAEERVTGRPATVTIQLTKGWNLIGIPIRLDNGTVESVFKENITYIRILYGYENGKWVYHIPGNPHNTLTELKPCHGYWAFAETNLTIRLTGTMPSEIPVAAEGWNLIAVCGVEAVSVAEYLNANYPNWLIVYGWEREEWLFYLRGRGGSLAVLEPGKGYWVYINPQ